MRPADDPTVDYKAIVQRGYDLCASTYDEFRKTDIQTELDRLLDWLDDGAKVLDIGCGSGAPVTQALAKRFAVTGVDISSEMVRLAQTNVPEARFIHADITVTEFSASNFDAVVAFYSLFHIPREEHHDLFRRIHNWLKPGGYILGTLSHHSESAHTENDFFGETMYWSNYGMTDYVEILTGLGFSILKSSVIGHGYSDDQEMATERHPLVFAQKQHMAHGGRRSQI